MAENFVLPEPERWFFDTENKEIIRDIHMSKDPYKRSSCIEISEAQRVLIESMQNLMSDFYKTISLDTSAQKVHN
jgi:hypothetical protein